MAKELGHVMDDSSQSSLITHTHSVFHIDLHLQCYTDSAEIKLCYIGKGHTKIQFIDLIFFSISQRMLTAHL